MPFGTFLNGVPPTQLRGIQWLTFTELAQVGSVAITSDGGGGGTATWSYGPGTVACRVDPLNRAQAEELTADRITDRTPYEILLPAGTPVEIENRVRVLGRGTFEITSRDDPTDEWVSRIEAIQVF